MNYYQLDTKEQDADFINGNPVFCEATITEDEFNSGRINAGDRLVIRLTNGAKYLGKVLHYEHTIKNGIVSGVLEIKRANRGD